MHIHAKGLLYFDAIRRHGSIRAAARQLFVDASAVNRQLIQLEQELGFPLFERLNTGLQLTAAGELFARHTTNVLQDASWLANELDMLRGIQRGEVQIAAVESLLSHLLPSTVGDMLERFPGVRLNTMTAGSTRIHELVATGVVDVGLAFDAPSDATILRVAQSTVRIGALMPNGHPLASEAQVSIEQCAQWPLILGTPGLAAYEFIAPALQTLNAAPAIAARSDSIELMKRLVARGCGIAFQSALGLDTAHPVDRRVCLVPLVDAHGAPITGELGIYVRAGRTLPPAVAAFVDAATAKLTGPERLDFG